MGRVDEAHRAGAAVSAEDQDSSLDSQDNGGSPQCGISSWDGGGATEEEAHLSPVGLQSGETDRREEPMSHPYVFTRKETLSVLWFGILIGILIGVILGPFLPHLLS